MRDDCDSVPRDGNIEVSDNDARLRWSKAFGVTESVLMKAVGLLGTSIRELRKLFCRDQKNVGRK
jgi:hypothetical protein